MDRSEKLKYGLSVMYTPFSQQYIEFGNTIRETKADRVREKKDIGTERQAKRHSQSNRKPHRHFQSESLRQCHTRRINGCPSVSITSQAVDSGPSGQQQQLSEPADPQQPMDPGLCGTSD
ncbi:hypothetical protein RRG08_045412 [Elysia crispata]|uniref:Uncharacterized protein n=1 Tax=Elysia crispata TaxID=231223 RepID=A0AAE0XMP5_9GAST|nr:hypothetical protein RRG08_045412 [Elysia crispata]